MMQQSLSGRDTARALRLFFQEFCVERTKIAGCTVRGDRSCGRGNFYMGEIDYFAFPCDNSGMYGVIKLTMY